MNASLRISVSSLRAHKRRFAGTFLAVLLGVAFLAGTLVYEPAASNQPRPAERLAPASP